MSQAVKMPAAQRQRCPRPFSSPWACWRRQRLMRCSEFVRANRRTHSSAWMQRQQLVAAGGGSTSCKLCVALLWSGSWRRKTGPQARQ